MKKFSYNSRTKQMSIAHPHLNVGWNNYLYVGLAPLSVEAHRIYETKCQESQYSMSHQYQDHEFGSGKTILIPRRENADTSSKGNINTKK